MVGPVDQHAHFRRSALARIQHAHLVVDEADVGHRRVGLRQTPAQCARHGIERSRRVYGGIADALRGLHRHGDFALRVFDAPLANRHVHRPQPEEILLDSQRLADEELE